MRDACFAYLVFNLVGCAAQTMVRGIDLQPEVKEPLKMSENTIQALDQLDQEDATLVRDSYFIAKATYSAAQGHHAKSVDHWWSALAHADKATAMFAMGGLVTALSASQSASEPSELSRHLTTGLQTRPLSDASKKLAGNQLEMAAILTAATSTDPTSGPDSLPATTTVLSPAESGIPRDDPLLVETAERFCSREGRLTYHWDAWVDTLPPALQEYWQALTFQCIQSATFTQKVSLWRHAYSQLSAHPTYSAYQIHALRNLIVLLRRNDKRHEAAEKYLLLVNRWLSPDISVRKQAWSKEEMLMSRIDDFLWAARYRALIGDYKRGKTFAILAEDYIEEAFSQLQHSQKALKDLVELKAEAIHIRAFRISAAHGDYAHAAYLASMGSKIQELPKEWRLNFLWYRGLFLYLDGQYERAERTWSKLVNLAKGARLAKTRFWLARTQKKLGKHDAARHQLDRLASDDPLNFYSVVATTLTRLQSPKRWQYLFPSLRQLNSIYERRKHFLMSRLHDRDDLRYWLRKSEILIENRMPGLGRKSLEVLSSKIRKQLSPQADMEAHLYVSRLELTSGNVRQAIARSSLIARKNSRLWDSYPDQILVAFPKPYSRLFSRFARNEGIDPNLLLAIARQESAFDHKAVSPAGAYGLMQLIPKTANRFTTEQSAFGDSLIDQLHTPAFNVQVASRYVKFLDQRYSDNFPAAIAAYNAGEYAVDRWLQLRNHDDLLTWIELIPFSETREYVKRVWRNHSVYRFLQESRIGDQSVQQRSARRAEVDSRY